MSQKIDRQKTYRDLVWVTSDGSRIAIKRMTTGHLYNAIKFIERNMLEELEKNIPNERSLKMQLAGYLSTKDELIKIDSPGAEYIEPAITEIKEKLNAKFIVPQTAITKALDDNEHYQGMVLELERRNIVTQGNPELLEAIPFLETKMDVKVKDILPGPDGIAMIIEVILSQGMSNKITTGDYIIDCNNPIFQINFLHRYHDTDDNAQISLTINARTQGEKAEVLSNLKVGDSIVVY